LMGEKREAPCIPWKNIIFSAKKRRGGKEGPAGDGDCRETPEEDNE